MSFEKCRKCGASTELRLKTIQQRDGFLEVSVVCEHPTKKSVCGQEHVLRYKQRESGYKKKARVRHRPRI